MCERLHLKKLFVFLFLVCFLQDVLIQVFGLNKLNYKDFTILYASKGTENNKDIKKRVRLFHLMLFYQIQNSKEQESHFTVAPRRFDKMKRINSD